MIDLDSTFALWGIAAAIGVMIALALHLRRRRRVARALGDPDLAARLIGGDLRRAPWTRVALVAAGSICLAAGLADPRWGAPEGGEARGGPVVFVFDVSNSMLAADVDPDRLERGRAAARAIVRALPGAPIGIVAFAGRAYALSPPTTDPGAVDLYLAALHPDMVTQTGSSLAAAVRQGLALLLATEDALSGALVLVTDGDTDDDPGVLRETIAIAARAGVPVYTLGAGTGTGGLVPERDRETGRRVGVMRSAGGDPVISRLDDVFLRDIADETGGLYVPLSDAGSAERMAAAVARRPASTDAVVAAESRPPGRYAWFAALALVLLAAETVVHRRSRT